MRTLSASASPAFQVFQSFIYEKSDNFGVCNRTLSFCPSLSRCLSHQSLAPSPHTIHSIANSASIDTKCSFRCCAVCALLSVWQQNLWIRYLIIDVKHEKVITLWPTPVIVKGVVRWTAIKILFNSFRAQPSPLSTRHTIHCITLQ